MLRICRTQGVRIRHHRGDLGLVPHVVFRRLHRTKRFWAVARPQRGDLGDSVLRVQVVAEAECARKGQAKALVAAPPSSVRIRRQRGHNGRPHGPVGSPDIERDVRSLPGPYHFIPDSGSDEQGIRRDRTGKGNDDVDDGVDNDHVHTVQHRGALPLSRHGVIVRTAIAYAVAMVIGIPYYLFAEDHLVPSLKSVN